MHIVNFIGHDRNIALNAYNFGVTNQILTKVSSHWVHCNGYNVSQFEVN